MQVNTVGVALDFAYHYLTVSLVNRRISYLIYRLTDDSKLFQGETG